MQNGLQEGIRRAQSVISLWACSILLAALIIFMDLRSTSGILKAVNRSFPTV
jgi:hypothetical protein